jgi:hypothetical protein
MFQMKGRTMDIDQNRDNFIGIPSPQTYRACVRFEDFTAVTMKHTDFWDVTPCTFVKTDVSEERSASIIRVTRIGGLLTTSAVFFAACVGC